MDSADHDDTPITLTQHILAQQHAFPEATGDFSTLLHAIEIASKYISSKVRCAGLFNLYGAEGTTNVQGEVVKKLDVISNNSMITALRRSQTVSLMVSEENEEPIYVPEHPRAKYVVVFDPLDGSSNVDANVTIGTIFGVYRKQGPADKPAVLADALQPGSALVASGYTMYGSATTLVLTTGEGVNGFTLDPSLGEFVLTHPDIRCKPKHTIFSVNEGNSMYWSQPTLDYIKSIKLPESPGVKPYSARYVGSMVADVHRTLLYGGIFMYPADSNSPSGKLRLLYESNPMSMIIEQAGGKSTTGTARVMDLVPTSIHERCPIYIGSSQCVDELLSF
eukprot:CAMPEP_0174245732 /NCGR_PEP_ID=MMETSP0417-20130205/40487_1 /TAXON_ID=242541 /ORGANISM="Mayorella sp, Strain BSH-02190019" /LENGTH=334 /DNA_ID=CAMNT_0015325547 /DNA_START=67 /DNA_END=1068 /DNA_ORIENTATION=-